MAKKKYKEKINYNAPLQAVTIGEIKENKFGWLGIIFLFALFAGIVFYLPDLFEMYEQYTKTPVGNAIPLNNTVNNTTPKPNDDDTTSYTFLEKTGFKFEKIDVQNITYNEGALSYKVKNKTNEAIILDSLNLSFELYDSNNNVLASYAISGSLEANGSKEFSHSVFGDMKNKVVAYNIIEEIKDNSSNTNNNNTNTTTNNNEVSNKTENNSNTLENTNTSNQTA